MKLLRFDAGAGPRLGVLRDETVIDLELVETSWEQVLRVGPDFDRIAALAAKRVAEVPLSSVRLLAPLRPGKYLGIGMNYRAHAEEAASVGVETPKKQLWFNKQTSCISGPYDDIAPGVSTQVDYEVELAVVIGRTAKSVPEERAKEHIFGYMVANDVSARDYQFHTPTFTMGKSFDTHGPIGPWIVTADEIADPHALGLRCFVNGEVRQSSNTSLMTHSIFQQIEYLTSAFTLEPGDVLATGTPEGVGLAMNPPVYLQAGDIVRCEIDGIGVIENRVA